VQLLRLFCSRDHAGSRFVASAKDFEQQTEQLDGRKRSQGSKKNRYKLLATILTTDKTG
jgi:hypothetical protein